MPLMSSSFFIKKNSTFKVLEKVDWVTIPKYNSLVGFLQNSKDTQPPARSQNLRISSGALELVGQLGDSSSHLQVQKRKKKRQNNFHSRSISGTPSWGGGSMTRLCFPCGAKFCAIDGPTRGTTLHVVAVQQIS